MRDIVVTVLFAIVLPYCLMHAEYAVALWYWASLFQPQTQTYGFAQSIPFATIAGILTIASWLLSKVPKRPPATWLVILMVLMAVWTGITTLNAVYYDFASTQWNLFVRLLAMVLLGIAIVQSRRQLEVIVWAICLSLGYYGFKTGLFALRGGLGANFYRAHLYGWQQ